VCDDDVVVPMALQLSTDDVEVHEAHRGRELVRMARDVRPDAVVLDVKMPDGNGLDAARELRADPLVGDVVVVVLTAGHDPARRAEVLAAGADEYVAKPFEPEELVALLRRLLAVPPAERRVRRTLHRARLGVGRDDGGTADLPEAEVPDEPESRGGRFRRRGRK
jgi:DNA-binding response OmpR family regulator